jgi:hypothetical protein
MGVAALQTWQGANKLASFVCYIFYSCIAGTKIFFLPLHHTSMELIFCEEKIPCHYCHWPPDGAEVAVFCPTLSGSYSVRNQQNRKNVAECVSIPHWQSITKKKKLRNACRYLW